MVVIPRRAFDLQRKGYLDVNDLKTKMVTLEEAEDIVGFGFFRAN